MEEEVELDKDKAATVAWEQRLMMRQGEGEGEGHQQQQQVVYCAVPVGKKQEKEAAREWKANMLWVLANIPRTKRLVFLHIHRPPSRINMMGAWVPVSQLAEQEVTAYRRLEEEEIGKVLDDLVDICKTQKVNASKIIISTDDDTARGLVQFVEHHGVTELVMGAASDRAYHRKMRAPRSKKALTVQRKANPSCKIWFVCKGNLICTREPSEGSHGTESSTTASTSPRSSVSDNSRSRSSPRVHSETFSAQESNDQKAPTSRENNAKEADDHLSHQQGAHNADEDEGEMDDALYEKLKDAIMEAENLKHEAYEETRRRQMAERDLAEANKTADEAESSYQREANRRKEVEAMLARERAEMERDSQELNDMLEQTHKANDRSAELELQMARSEATMSDLEARLSESYSILDALRRQAAGSDEVGKNEEADVDGDHRRPFFRRFRYSELDEATNHFDESARIDGGDGGRGKVYRGRLTSNNDMVVKVLSPDVAVGEVRFTRAVEAISRVRHPGLVTLVGACPEARAVVHELVPGGSLEERLASLPWHVRCGVAYRTCSALAFLHSTRTVHGDVRPANILLLDSDDSSSSCKLAGLGTYQLVRSGGGLAALAYADPHYIATGELTPRCDVYSLGVVLLRLVTGMPPFLARKAARDAARGSRAWNEVVDQGWRPMERAAREVALVGLRCCDTRTTLRRDAGSSSELLEEVRSVLEDAMRSAAPGPPPSTDGGEEGAPSYFLCPILKEVMRDPRIAGDGFSYEAEAIKEWLDSGHDTSPMTNLKLPTRELVPNHSLRSAIHEWRQRHPRLALGLGQQIG